jgi:formate dehydrogenase subunit gamma
VVEAAAAPGSEESTMSVDTPEHGPVSVATDPSRADPLIADDEVFVRMSLNQRLQHVLLILSFVMLVATGLPLIYPDMSIWNLLPAGQEGFRLRSLLHRIAGVGLITVSLWHLLYALLTEEGGRYVREMLPTLLDGRQFFQSLMVRLGIGDALYRRGTLCGFFDRHPWLRGSEPPEYGKYNWIEKFEYLAVFWGNSVMILTGLCLWFFEAAFAMFPKPVLDIIKLVHGFEALLAFLSIIMWHMYNVHLNPDVFPMSRIWLSGKVTGAHLRHSHPAWYRQIAEERREKRRVERALQFYEARHGGGQDV